MTPRTLNSPKIGCNKLAQNSIKQPLLFSEDNKVPNAIFFFMDGKWPKQQPDLPFSNLRGSKSVDRRILKLQNWGRTRLFESLSGQTKKAHAPKLGSGITAPFRFFINNISKNIIPWVLFLTNKLPPFFFLINIPPWQYLKSPYFFFDNASSRTGTSSSAAATPGCVAAARSTPAGTSSSTGWTATSASGAATPSGPGESSSSGPFATARSARTSVTASGTGAASPARRSASGEGGFLLRIYPDRSFY